MSCNKPIDQLGEWQAVSKVLYTIYGDLEIKKESLSFTILGEFDFKVQSTGKDFTIIETNKKVDCGSIVKLGPRNGKEIEFAVYGKSYSDNELCSWGIYESKM